MTDKIKLYKDGDKRLVRWEILGTFTLENCEFTTTRGGINLASDPRVRREYYKNLEEAFDRVRELTNEPLEIHWHTG